VVSIFGLLNTGRGSLKGFRPLEAGGIERESNVGGTIKRAFRKLI